VADREQELREAIEFSKKVEADPSLLGEDFDLNEYWKSVEDVKQKLELIEGAKEGKYVLTPEQLEGYTSPFATVTPEGVKVDIPTAIKAGQLDVIKGVVTPVQIREAEKDIQQEKEYRATAAEQAAVLRELEPYKTPEGYNLVEAIRAGKIEEVRKAGFDPMAVVEAQSLAAEVASRESLLNKLADWGSSEKGYNLAGALASGAVTASALRASGLFSASDIKTAEEQYKAAPVVTPPEPKKTRFEKWSTAPLGRDISLSAYFATLPKGAVVMPGEYEAWKAQQPTPSLLQRILEFTGLAGMTPQKVVSAPEFQLATLAIGAEGAPVFAKLPGLAPAFSWAVKLEQVGQPTSWLARAASLMLTAAKYSTITGGITGLGATATGLLFPTITRPEIDVSAYKIDTSKVGTTEAFERASEVLTPEGYIKPGISEVGAARALAQAGQKPTIPLEVYERLDPESQRFYTPSERRSMAYETGIVGVLGRGTVGLLEPPRVALERLGGWPGKLAVGMYQYAAPLTLVSSPWREKGPVSFVSLIPHAGPTLGYPIVAGAPLSQQLIGAGFFILPGVTGAVVPPVLGWMKGLVKERPGPWYQKGYYHPITGEPMAQYGGLWRTVKQWEAYFAKLGRPVPQELRIDIAEAMKGPQVGATIPKPTPTAVEAAQLKAGGTWQYDAAYGQWKVGAPEGYVLIRTGGTGPWRLALKSVPSVVQPKGVVTSEELAARFVPGEPYTTRVTEPPAVVQQVRIPFSQQFMQFMRAIPTKIPTVAKAAPAAMVTLPVMGMALPAMVAPALVAPIDQTAKFDVATVDQMLKQNLIDQVQHDQLVNQIKEVQQRVQTQQEQRKLTAQQVQQLYNQQVKDMLKQQLTRQEQAQYQLVQERIQQTQKAKLQQQLQIEQQRLQQMQQQQVTQTQIQQQQQVIQQMQQQIQQQPPIKKLVPPLIPLPEEVGFAGRIGGGGGLGARGRLPKSGKFWDIPGLQVIFTDPFTLGLLRHPIAPPRRIKYGATEQSPTMIRRLKL
jgi:hypothetical protein